ncbi:ABC transporter substrate-binding protein [Lutibaculum baratangense]|uniref:Dipeptide-binding ABC transporter, periplasmic substrate-binding component n=1 Tax=Lutibaculum baratangense AMV1 TaxID=631454 RepID=V4T744_9HYPH|nr:ABC transporter substrate-binding protein [Lutibaculum baratangense]ESR22438.1 Dipeptide-binding ABC transporter, periplasmic substrate-binding component [Lutibaculum baratangense AMV1]
MKHFRSLALAAALFAAAVPGAKAETPDDTLVIAWQFDDIISLDPAEVFEFSSAEMIGNSYERLIGYDLENVSDMFGVVAESWDVSEDGKTITFKIREGKKFASGNDLTAEDVVFSLQRAVKLDLSPAFILGQFGLTKENVEEKIQQTGDYELTFEMDQAYAPTFVLYCMTATVASVVDKALVMEHEQDGDLGHEWMKTNYAGSGPYAIVNWSANQAVVLERNDNYSEPAPLARVIYQHVPEGSTQRLLLEQGDVDIARNLSPEDLASVASRDDIKVESNVKGAVYYLGLNQKNENLAKPEVRQALKYLVDYEAIADTIMKDRVKVHQAFLPEGFLGAVNETPFALDVDKAKELLAEAGLADGFSVTMDTRNTPDITGMAEAIQQTFAQGGVDLEIIPGDGKQTLTKYRARQHDIYIGRWGPDYQDPHTNADTFAANPDNSDDASAKPLAWRNAWDIPELTEKTQSAVLESDPDARAEIYEELQRTVMDEGPFVIMFQEIENAAMRTKVENFVLGPSFDSNSFAQTSKN